MVALFGSALATFFVVIDPVGCAPIFTGLTAGTSVRERRRTALRSVLIAAGILFVFALVGEDLLGALGISLDAFRIAGGITLFLVAVEMIFERSTQRREAQAQEVTRDPAPHDVSVFPMAIPMIAGPGSIASVMLLMSQGPGLAERLTVLGALVVILVLTLVVLLSSGQLMRLLGRRVEGMLTRVFGVILSALAVQFVIDGVLGSLGR